jgi:hypothetical protein
MSDEHPWIESSRGISPDDDPWIEASRYSHMMIILRLDPAVVFS